MVNLRRDYDGKTTGKAVGSWTFEKLVESRYTKEGDIFTCWSCPTGIRDRAKWAAPQINQIAFFQRSFYAGYRSMFAAMYEFLQDSGNVFFVATIAQHASTAPNDGFRFYLTERGKYKYVLDAGTFIVEEQSVVGDGTFEGLWWGKAGYSGLPVRANDLAFAMDDEGVAEDAAANVEPLHVDFHLFIASQAPPPLSLLVLRFVIKLFVI
ncbi:hypothetical protein Hypma_002756 [Hypsizygus marmoreus]|uniref:Uncharacterized protein n=1 Tax=Hypsizygus marmoreus TaxID=39966 RepID=A0A369J7N6_HYPMA|nr:hypothetical protein Hypma_002756 [Hypsizygus marmoreus]